MAEEKFKTENILIYLGIAAIGGVGLYYLLKKKKPEVGIHASITSVGVS